MIFPYQIINGEILAENEARIPLNDLGLLRSYSVFDFFNVKRSVPVFIDDHVTRLMRSADVLDLQLKWSPGHVKQMCLDLIAKNNASDARFRIIVTGGFSKDGYSKGDPNIFMMLHEWRDYPAELYTGGAKLLSAGYQRDMPSVKTTIYIQSVHYQKKLRKAGAIEVLYHWKGTISECSRSNIVFVDENNSLITPKQGILNGITRKHLLAIARSSCDVIERDVSMDEIPAMKEAFLTATTKAIMPVSAIDDHVIGDGKPGEITKGLMSSFSAYVDDYVEKHQPAQST